MSNDRFMELVRAWREQTPDLKAAYVAAIPKQVAASMAFEGDPVDAAFLEEHLASL